MEILRTKKVFIQPTTELWKVFAEVIPCQSLSTALACSVAELRVSSAPSVCAPRGAKVLPALACVVSFWNLLSFFFF